jgi:hypothetical protein
MIRLRHSQLPFSPLPSTRYFYDVMYESVSDIKHLVEARLEQRVTASAPKDWNAKIAVNIQRKLETTVPSKSSPIATAITPPRSGVAPAPQGTRTLHAAAPTVPSGSHIAGKITFGNFDSVSPIQRDRSTVAQRMLAEKVAALRIQRCYRRHRAKCAEILSRYAEMANARQREREEAAAIRIQRCWLRFRTKRSKPSERHKKANKPKPTHEHGMKLSYRHLLLGPLPYALLCANELTDYLSDQKKEIKPNAKGRNTAAIKQLDRSE